ncbi:MAG: hypothetical protein ACR2OH_12710, partial [Microthrixaceae bacterium]
MPAAVPYGAPMPVQSNGLAIAAMVLGIVALVTMFCYGLGLILGILAVVFGVLGRKRALQMNGEGHG